MARLLRSYGIYKLGDPAAIGPGIAFHGPGVRLTTPYNGQNGRFRDTTTRLGRPTVVTAASTQIFTGPATSFAYSRRGTPKFHLEPPAVINTKPLAPPVATHLARIRPANTFSFLRSPVNTVGLEDQGRIRVYLARIRPKPTFVALYGPAELDFSPQVYYIAVSLAPSRRGVPKSHLFAPTVADVKAQGQIRTKLIRIRPRATIAHVYGPTVIDIRPQTYYLRTTFTRIKPRPTFVALYGPATLDLSPQTYFISTNLAPSKRGVPKSRLLPPAVADTRPQTYYLNVSLAPSFRGKPKPRLFPPSVIDLRPQAYYLALALAPSFRGKPKPRLFPPIIPPVAPPVAEEIAVQLVRARYERRLALSRLAPPTVIDVRPQTYYLGINLAPSKRGLPRFFLRPPADTVGLEDQGRVVTRLVRIRPRATLAQVYGPTVIDLSPQAYYLAVSLAPSKRGRPKSHLFVPAVIDLRSQTYYLSLNLAPSRRGVPKSILRPPTDTTGLEDQGSIRTHFARIRPVPTFVALYGPAAIDFSPQAYYLSVNLAYSLRGKPKSILREPSRFAATPKAETVLVANLAYSRRGAPKSFLREVIYEARVYAPITTHLVRIRPRPTFVALYGPVVVDQAAVQTQIATHFTRIRPPRTISFLRAPTTFYRFAPIQGRLAPVRDRNPIAHYSLGEPTVVNVAPSYSIAITHFARIRVPQVLTFLQPPTIVDYRPQTYYISVSLAYSLRGKPKSALKRPTVIDIRPQTYFIATALAYSRRGVPKSFLRGPTDTVGIEDQGRVNVHLVRIRPARTVARIVRPAVIDLRPQTYFVSVNLTYSQRGKPKSILHEPSRYAPTPKAKTVLAVNLTYSRRGKPKPFLRKVVYEAKVYAAIRTRLVRIRPVPTFVALYGPIVVDQPAVATKIVTSLARSRPPKTSSFLRASTPFYRFEPIRGRLTPVRDRNPIVHSLLGRPAVVSAFVARSIETALVRIRPVHTIARLVPPRVIDLRPQTYFVSVTLAYSLRGKPKSILHEPSKFAPTPKAETVVSVTLAPQKRGRAKPFLRKVIYDARVYAPVRVKLAASKRGKPIGGLRPPVLIDLIPQGRVVTSLAESRRLVAKSSLSTPVVVRAFSAQAIATTFVRITHQPVRSKLSPAIIPPLAPREERFEVTVAFAESRRPKFRSFLPTVIYGARTYAPIRVVFAPQPKPKTISKLFPPAVIDLGLVPARFTLAPSRFPQTIAQLFPPTVIDYRPQTYYLRVTLTQIRPVPVYPKLSLTEIVFPPFVAPKVAMFLAPSSRGIPRYFTIHPTTLRFIPPHGDICGFDTTPTAICADEETTTGAVGGDQTTSAITGTDRTGSSISGTDSSLGNVTGGDQKAT